MCVTSSFAQRHFDVHVRLVHERVKSSMNTWSTYKVGCITSTAVGVQTPRINLSMILRKPEPLPVERRGSVIPTWGTITAIPLL